MKLTVGSLPSAVYWRRRAAVLGGVLIVALVFWASCSGSATSSGEKKTAGTAKSPASGSPSASRPTAEESSSPSVAPPSVAPTSAAPASETSRPADGPSGSCTDDEILLTPQAEQATAPRGREMTLYLKVKNVSSRPCPRDLGADAQELFLLKDAAKVWSSDACDPLHGVRIVNLVPGIEQAFTVQWNGRSSANGCTDQQAPAAGTYQLVARLGGKHSTPAAITLT